MATILIVEDELLLAECYMRWLAHAGHKTVHVRDAQAALDALDDELPDVLLLDMLLPGANGIQLLHTLQSHTDFAHIPVIICSNALPERTPDFSAYGVKAVIDKTTLTREHLAAAVAGVLL